jgi:hypothetical protein
MSVCENRVKGSGHGKYVNGEKERKSQIGLKTTREGLWFCSS